MLGDLTAICLRCSADKGASRSPPFVALGGGVHRKPNRFCRRLVHAWRGFLQFPRPCFAHVDSSVGGKVGFDSTFGKDTGGAFYPPVESGWSYGASCSTSRPGNLPTECGEVWKYGAILDLIFSEPPRRGAAISQKARTWNK